MKTKRSQRRYTDKMDLLADIHNSMRRLNQINRELDEMETIGKHYMRNHPELEKDGRYMLEKVDRMRGGRVARLELHIKKLKNAYAAFQTGLLPGMGDDVGVVLEPLK